MAYRNIITSENPLLRKKSRPVTSFDDRLSVLIDDMFETMDRAEGVGLAAVQVGILRRVVVMDCEESRLELVNPEIIKTEGEQREEEGCLSIPERSGVTLRPMKVQVKAQDRNGKWHVYAGEGLKARCFCHEIDHLDGILYTDKLVPDGGE